MKVAGPNISPGPGNVAATYTPEDWVRTLRHGVKPDGKPLFIMPSGGLQPPHDDDTGAVIAYVKSLAPAAGGEAVVKLPLPVKVIYGFGGIPTQWRRSITACRRRPGANRSERRAWQARCRDVYRLPRRRPLGWQDSRRTADWLAAANLTPATRVCWAATAMACSSPPCSRPANALMAARSGCHLNPLRDERDRRAGPCTRI